MTPQERQLINELFQRLASLENNPRDPDAEAMIREGLRRAPNAVYSLVQTVLVQDEALKAANNRIQDYEQQFGGPAAGGAAAARLPRHHARLASSAATSRAAPCRACRRAGRRLAAGPTRGASRAYAPQQGYPQQQGYPPAIRLARRCSRRRGGGGGSFLGTAAAAAAGMIGGSLLMSGIRSAWRVIRAADRHRRRSRISAAASGSPGSGNAASSDLAREAGLNDIAAAGAEAAEVRSAPGCWTAIRTKATTRISTIAATMGITTTAEIR